MIKMNSVGRVIIKSAAGILAGVVGLVISRTVNKIVFQNEQNKQVKEVNEDAK